MYIRELSLQNFRNYEFLNLKLHRGTNVFVGNNAQGKTNILEAIYLCATARSHRTNKEREVIKWDEKEAHIQIDIQKKTIEDMIDFHLDAQGKGVAINKMPIKRLGDLLGVLNVVMFSPEDLQMIKKGPGQRRRFIDIELCQLDRVYYFELQKYHQVLKQRNKLLKNYKYTKDAKDLLDVWDRQIAQYGERVINKRENFINNLSSIAKKIHFDISGDKEELDISYDPSTKAEDYIDRLEKSRESDIFRRHTTIGPHRDDMVFEINGMDLKTYGSQGQQRTVVLSIKLAQLQMTKNLVGESPVLLLDDVLSELDINRQKFLFEYTKNVQTLITCTGIEESVWDMKNINKLFKVANGKVTRG